MRVGDRLCAGVILFHPDEGLAARVATYGSSVERLYVADNSDPPLRAADWIPSFGPQATWIAMNGNQGVAAALNAVAERAQTDGFDWMLTMDQDAELPRADLDEYLSEVREATDPDSVALFVPLHVPDDRPPPRDQPRFEQIQIAMTAHNLLNLKVHRDLGGFLDGLFIDEVDHEYCLRAIARGYRIIRCNQIPVRHCPGDVATVQLGGRELTYVRHAPARVYTIVRNSLILRRRHGRAFPKVTRERVRRAWIVWKETVRFQSGKLRSLWLGIRGAVDGLLGRLGPPPAPLT